MIVSGRVAERTQVIVVADLVQPHNICGIQRFLDRNVGHRSNLPMWPSGHALRPDLVQAIRTGFEADLLVAAGDYFEVPAARIRAITRVPDTTAHRLVKRHAPLDASASASERLWRLADVAVMAEDVFEDELAAKQWLRSPKQAFHDAAPLDYLETEPGAKTVRQVLNAIAAGGAV